jgi:hypothetical protein
LGHLFAHHATQRGCPTRQSLEAVVLVSPATQQMTHLGPVPVTFRLATWNLRYDVQPDNISVAKSLAALSDLHVAPPRVPPGERPWSARRIRVAQRLGASHVDLVGAFQNRLVGNPALDGDDNVLCM